MTIKYHRHLLWIQLYSTKWYAWSCIWFKEGTLDSSGDSAGLSDTIKVEKSEAISNEATAAAVEDTDANLDPSNSIEVKEYDAYTPVITTANESYNYSAKLDPSNAIKLNQNDAYALEQPVTTSANESYNYPAKFDPSNTIEAKENEAYAMSIYSHRGK